MGERRKNKGEKRERVNQSQHTGMEERGKGGMHGKERGGENRDEGSSRVVLCATKHAHKSEKWNNEKKGEKDCSKSVISDLSSHRECICTWLVLACCEECQ